MSDLKDFCIDTDPYNGEFIAKYTGKSKEVVIPEGIAGIGAYAFSENKTLEKVVIPDGVIFINMGAFSHCANLKEVVFPNRAVLLGDDVFLNTALRELVVPANTEFSHVLGDNKKREHIIPLAFPLVTPSQVKNNAYKICLTLGYLLHKELYMPKVAATYEKFYQANADVVIEAARRHNIFLKGLTEDVVGGQDVFVPRAMTLKEARDKKFAFEMKEYGYKIVGYYGESTIVDIPYTIGKTDVMGVDPCAFAYNTVLRCSGKLFARLNYADQLPAILAYLFRTVDFSADQMAAMDKCIKKKAFRYYEYAVEAGEVAMLHNLLEKLPHSFTLAQMDALLQKGSQSAEMTATLLQLKKSLFSEQDILEYESEELELEAGMDSWGLEEWSDYIHVSRKNKYKDGYTVDSVVKKHARIIIPDSIEGVPVIAIENHAFCDNRNLQEVVIGPSVKTVESAAFDWCRKLEKVFVASADTILQACAFADCPKVTIYAPSGSYAEKYAKRYKIPFVAE